MSSAAPDIAPGAAPPEESAIAAIAMAVAPEPAFPPAPEPEPAAAMPDRPRRRGPPRPIAAVFGATLRRLLASPRTALVLAVAVLPVFWSCWLALDPDELARRMPAPAVGSVTPLEAIAAPPSPGAFAFGWILLHMYLQCGAALAGVLYATGGASIAADAERGALSLLLCRPVRRWQLWLGRRLAVDAASFVVLAPGLACSFVALVGPGEPFVLIAAVGILALSVAAWSSLFSLFGLFRGSLVASLLYAFAWEFGNAQIDGGENARALTLWHYQRSLVRAALNDSLFGLGLADAASSALALAGVTLGASAAAAFVFSRREIRAG